MTRRVTLHEVRRDDGLTLVELIIYSALSALLLAVLASVFITSWQADATTRRRDAATGAAHVITNSLQTSIRNASGFTINGGLLRARVATGATDWECRAWRLTNPRTIEGEKWYELQYNHGNAAIDDASAGWANLLKGLSGGEGEGVLVRGNPTADKPFGEQGSLLKLNLMVIAVDLGKPTLNGTVVPVSGDVVAQARGEGSPTSC